METKRVATTTGIMVSLILCLLFSFPEQAGAAPEEPEPPDPVELKPTKPTNPMPYVIAGWNNPVSFGFLLEFYAGGPLAITAGAGLSLWGPKGSLGIRLYSSHPEGYYIGLGGSGHTGWTPNFNSSEGRTEYDMAGGYSLYGNIGYAFGLESGWRFFIEAGYLHTFQKLEDSIIYLDGQPQAGADDFIEAFYPNGVSAAIGVSLPL